MERIKDFEDELDDEHEVAVQLASFGKDILLSVTSIEFSNPSTLVFHGFINEQKATLIQHTSMLNFLLLAVPKQDTKKPPRRNGTYMSAKNVYNTNVYLSDAFKFEDINVQQPIWNTSLNHGGRPTSWIKIHTDIAGNLVTAYPVPGL
jgi:hypothetical protein